MKIGTQDFIDNLHLSEDYVNDLYEIRQDLIRRLEIIRASDYPRPHRPA